MTISGGRLYGGDQQKGAITITGGTVAGTSIHNVIRATEGQLTFGPGSKVDNSDNFPARRGSARLLY